jgi:hypothetical protein
MIVVNLYWIIARFSLLNGLVLLLAYGLFLIVLMLVCVCLVVFMLKNCSRIRRNGFRYGIRWDDFWRTLFVFALVITAIALVEWFVWWLILSKFVFLA